MVFLTEKNNYNEYWVISGTSTSYELKEEIKSWGGWWEPFHKCWCINTNKEDVAYKTLTACGLKLQFRR